MNEFLDTLSQIWDFFNSFWFPAAVAVVGIVFFVVMFVKANRKVDKHRRKSGKKLSTMPMRNTSGRNILLGTKIIRRKQRLLKRRVESLQY